MLKEFSAGYYIGRFHVDLYDGDHPVIGHDQHVKANEQVYASGTGVGRLDHPLVMKVDEQHFPVFPAEDVTEDTLGLPEDVLESTRVHQPPTPKEVLVAKAERALQLLKWTTPYTVDEPDFA